LLSLTYVKGTEKNPDNYFFTSRSFLQVCHITPAKAILPSCPVVFAICPWCIKTSRTRKRIAYGIKQDSSLPAWWDTWLWPGPASQV